jgi:hypothetical protein
MSEVPAEPQPETPAEPTPDEDAEGEESESNPPAEEGLPETDSPDGGETVGEPTPPEQAGESAPPQGLTQADWEARFQKVEKAWATYAKRVDAVWEEDTVKLIPLTVSPSAPPGFLSADDAGRIPDEVKKPLLDFLGITQETEYPLDSMKVACDLCHGMGKVSTESQVPVYRVLICRICTGTGLKPAGIETANGPGSPTLVPIPVGADTPPPPPKDVDGWNTPRLLPDGMPNPNYGRTPDYWDHQFPVGGVS